MFNGRIGREADARIPQSVRANGRLRCRGEGTAMNDVLTDHGDPEKRIADLDHQRANRNRAPGLLPSGSQDAAPSRRFLISAAPPSSRQMMKYTNLMMLGAMASLGVIYLLLFWVGALLDAESVMQVGGFVVFIAFLLLAMPAFGLFQRRMNRKKTVVVDIVSGGVTISASPGDNFPFGEAQLGKWTIAGYGETAKGTALHLRSGPHRFVIGGQDHRVATGTPLDAPPVDSVDATMWAPEFDDLLTAIGRRSALDARGPAAGEPTRCLLVPNVARTFSSSVFGSFKNTATALRLNTNPPQPTVAIDVADDAISVVDLASNARIASASPPHVIASPAASTRSAPYAGAMTMAVLIVRVASSHPLTIGCPDFAGPPQAGWSGKAHLPVCVARPGAFGRSTGVHRLGRRLADARREIRPGGPVGRQGRGRRQRRGHPGWCATGPAQTQALDLWRHRRRGHIRRGSRNDDER
ncbi:hypothetical protein A5725_12840 [Mycobacterium kubicae]|nr:hypothetical protein A5725_12840 [Mycobacterium kubicae]